MGRCCREDLQRSRAGHRPRSRSGRWRTSPRCELWNFWGPSFPRKYIMNSATSKGRNRRSPTTCGTVAIEQLSAISM